eukprot:3536889-Amphidinium_carterae.1
MKLGEYSCKWYCTPLCVMMMHGEHTCHCSLVQVSEQELAAQEATARGGTCFSSSSRRPILALPRAATLASYKPVSKPKQGANRS